MKRLSLAIVSGALLGALCFYPTPANAHLLDRPFEPEVGNRSVQTVPHPKPAVIVVRAGDTLTAIAATHHLTCSGLASYNHLADPNLITAGQRLTIPPKGWSSPDICDIPAKPSSATPATTVRIFIPSAISSPSGGFKACVEMRESTDGAGSPDLYGFLPSTWASLGLPGSPYTASPAAQSAAFDMLYARDGTSPWGPYDGC